MVPNEAKSEQSNASEREEIQHNNNNWKYRNTNAREQIRAQINYYFAQSVAGCSSVKIQTMGSIK